MKTTPFKLDVTKTSTRLNRLPEKAKLNAVENLLYYFDERLVFVSDVLSVAKTVKIQTNTILAEIKLLKSEPEIFTYADKIGRLQKFDFIEKSKVFKMNINRQLETIYRNFL